MSLFFIRFAKFTSPYIKAPMLPQLPSLPPVIGVFCPSHRRIRSATSTLITHITHLA
jgi:hypothetical protein